MRLALLISGGGTTAEAVIKAVQSGRLRKVEIAAVVSSRCEAAGLNKARKRGVKTLVVDPRRFVDQAEFGRELTRVFKKLRVDLVSQNGWLPKTPTNVVEAYHNRIINQHPGPLDPPHPDFGGVGMYGARVVCARLLYCSLSGDKNPWTEATTHQVTQEYDRGDLLKTKRLRLPLLTLNQINNLEKNADKLIEITKKVQTKLLPLEHENVIATLDLAGRGKLKPYRRKRRLVPESKHKMLHSAKQMAIKFFPGR